MKQCRKLPGLAVLLHIKRCKMPTMAILYIIALLSITVESFSPSFSKPPTADTNIVPNETVKPPETDSVLNSPVETTTEEKTGAAESVEEELLQGERIFIVPADTVLSISLDQPLSSTENKLGEVVKAKIAEPLYLGPYLVIPAESVITGKITDINAKRDKEGHNPYIVVDFDTFKRPSDLETVPFYATLIAYKTGMRGEDYVWRLPEKSDRMRSNIKSIVGGAVSGAFVNPIFGPLVGAGAALLKNSAVDRFARGGEVKIKEGKVIPVSVSRPFSIAVQ